MEGFIDQNLAIPLLRACIQTSNSDFIKEEQ